MGKLAYYPYLHWRCSKCGASGSIETKVSDDALLKWNRVIAAHQEASPGCTASNGRGMVVSLQEITIPD